MGMREVMQALSEGAGRQSAIGGLMFQDAQMREGRAYEAAMAKEAERRSNLEWKRRFDVSSEEARGQADIEHGYRMAEQEARLAAQAAEGEAGRSTQVQIAGMGETGATNRTQMLITGREDAAKLLADVAAANREEDRAWAIEDALSKAKSDTAKAILEGKIDRAKEAESHLSKLYEGLKDAGVEWDDETKTYVSGSEYMDQIHRAQDRVEAAWNDTGIGPLMKERNVNEIRLGYFEQGVVARVSLELKDQQWADVVNGLQSEKGSGDYNAALETIRPYIEGAIDASRIRVTNSERERIRDAVIERIGTYKGEVDAAAQKSGDLGDGEVSDAGGFSQDPAFQAGVSVAEAVENVIASFAGLDDIDNQIRSKAISNIIKKWQERDGLSDEEVIIRVQENANNAGLQDADRAIWNLFLSELSPDQGEIGRASCRERV